MASYLLQVLQGLEYLHGRRIVHLDIKPDNILVSCINTIKIVDFGSAQTYNPLVLRQLGRRVGTLEYMCECTGAYMCECKLHGHAGVREYMVITCVNVWGVWAHCCTCVSAQGHAWEQGEDMLEGLCVIQRECVSAQGGGCVALHMRVHGSVCDCRGWTQWSTRRSVCGDMLVRM